MPHLQLCHQKDQQLSTTSFLGSHSTEPRWLFKMWQNMQIAVPFEYAYQRLYWTYNSMIMSLIPWWNTNYYSGWSSSRKGLNFLLINCKISDGQEWRLWKSTTCSRCWWWWWFTKHWRGRSSALLETHSNWQRGSFQVQLVRQMCF